MSSEELDRIVFAYLKEKGYSVCAVVSPFSLLSLFSLCLSSYSSLRLFSLFLSVAVFLLTFPSLSPFLLVAFLSFSFSLCLAPLSGFPLSVLDFFLSFSLSLSLCFFYFSPSAVLPLFSLNPLCSFYLAPSFSIFFLFSPLASTFYPTDDSTSSAPQWLFRALNEAILSLLRVSLSSLFFSAFFSFLHAGPRSTVLRPCLFLAFSFHSSISISIALSFSFLMLPRLFICVSLSCLSVSCLSLSVSLCMFLFFCLFAPSFPPLVVFLPVSLFMDLFFCLFVPSFKSLVVFLSVSVCMYLLVCLFVPSFPPLVVFRAV